MRLAFLVLLALCAACQSAAPAPPQPSRIGSDPPARVDAAPEPATVVAIDASVVADASASKKTAPACAVPTFVQRGPAPVAHTLEGLVELFQDVDTTIRHVERDFGKSHDSHSHSTSYDIDAPLPEVERATIGWRRSQGREYLTSLSLDFRDAAQPTVQALATRLGVSAQVGREPVKNGCMDAICANIRFDRPLKPRPGAKARSRTSMTFELEAAGGRAALGSKDVAKLAVKRLYFSISEGGCGVGMPDPSAPPLPAPAPGPTHDLDVAMRAVAKELAQDPYDKRRITSLLERFGEVRVEYNDLSKFSWVRVFPEKGQLATPFCFTGFRYARDHDLLCTIAYSNRYLYETDGNATHRIFLMVELSKPYDGPFDRISHMEMTRVPRDWPDLVF